MLKIPYASKSVMTDGNGSLHLDYILLVSEVSLSDSYTLECYGIGIHCYRDFAEAAEIAEIENISFSSLEIDRMLMVLSEGTVTPTTVYQILDDMLAI